MNDNGQYRDVLWIAWEQHQRTMSLVHELGIPLVVMSSRRSRWFRHPLFTLRTMSLLLQRRPRVLMVQNPSWLLTTLAILLKPLLRYRLVVDAHNAGVYPFTHALERFAWVLPFFHRFSDLTIVTNDLLAAVVERHGGRALVLPDPLPSWPEPVSTEKPSREGRLVTYICTYADDEPFADVLLAAAELPPDVTLAVTGDDSRCPADLRQRLSDNVTFTGFLPELEYRRQLAISDVVVDLTNFDDCLVCGAYEALALGVPLVLSDSPVNRALFPQGTVLTRNERGAIGEAIMKALVDSERLREQMRDLRGEYRRRWQVWADELRSYLGTCAPEIVFPPGRGSTP